MDASFKTMADILDQMDALTRAKLTQFPKKMWEQTHIKKMIDLREGGETEFPVQVHLRAMVYAMLSGGISWAKMEGQIDPETGRIMAAPASAEIIRVQPQGATVSVTAICQEENARLFCAASKDNGQMIAVATAKVIGDGTQRTYTLHLETADYCYVTVFLLSESMTPLCNRVQEFR